MDLSAIALVSCQHQAINPTETGRYGLEAARPTRVCQIYLPGSGWIEFDPTNGIVGIRDLIRVAVTRTPKQAIPLSGSYCGNADDELGMAVSVIVNTLA